MSYKGGLDFDEDICPILTSVAIVDPKKPGSGRENCRPDCAWYDIADGSCAIMQINVQLKTLNERLKKIEQSFGIPEANH